MAVFCMYVFGGGWGPILVGAISDAMGGGAAGLRAALIIVAFSGFASAMFLWIGSRHYPADMDRVKNAVLEAEK